MKKWRRRIIFTAATLIVIGFFCLYRSQSMPSPFILPKTLGTPPELSAAQRQVLPDFADLVAHAKHGKLILPPSGARLDAPVTIPASLRVIGNHHILAVSDNGQIIVTAGTRFSLESTVIYLEDSAAQPPHQAFIQFHGTLLRLTNNEIHNVRPTTLILPISPKRKAAQFQDTAYWFVLSENAAPSRMEVTGNQFHTYHPYSMGGFKIDGPISGIYSNNAMKYIHNSLRLQKADTMRIEDNHFFMDSFGAINISGHFVIRNNSILFPGGGIIGDGITVRSAHNSLVENNEIFGGSCDGMWVLSDDVDGLTFRGNRISSGITSGLHISAVTSQAKIRNITIENNIFASNSGPGLSIGAGKDIRIQHNFFHNNSPHFGAEREVLLAKGVEAIQSDNIYSVSIDAKWAKQLDFYRTHVNIAPADSMIPANE